MYSNTHTLTHTHTGQRMRLTSHVCFIGLNVDFTGVVSTVGGGGVLRERKKEKRRRKRRRKTLVAVAGDDIIYLWV